MKIQYNWKLLKFSNPTEMMSDNWNYWNWNYQPRLVRMLPLLCFDFCVLCVILWLHCLCLTWLISYHAFTSTSTHDHFSLNFNSRSFQPQLQLTIISVSTHDHFSLISTHNHVFQFPHTIISSSDSTRDHFDLNFNSWWFQFQLVISVTSVNLCITITRLGTL